MRTYKILRKRLPVEGEHVVPPYETIATIPYKICLQSLTSCLDKSYTDYSTEIGREYQYKVRYVNSCGTAAEVAVPDPALPLPSDRLTDQKLPAAESTV